jgi:hypothetical protein
MSIAERIEKLIFINEGIIGAYFVADQNWQVLSPILQDKEVYSRWDFSEGVDGVKIIRMALYTKIITDMYAILFDKDKKSGSLNNIISGLEDAGVIKELRSRFCLPSGVNIVTDHTEDEIDSLTKRLQEEDRSRKEEMFDRVLPSVVSGYKAFVESELALRIKSARSKIYAHKEIHSILGERKYYDAADLGLRYDDAEKLLSEAQILIFDANLLLKNSSYSLDSFLNHHKVVAKEYWAR